MPPGNQTRNIKISVDAPGVKAALDGIAKSMGGVSKNTQSLASDFGLLKNSFIGYIGALQLGRLASLSDEMQNLSNRIKLVSKVGEDNGVVMQRLLDIANETKQPVGQVGEIYARMGVSMKSANVSAEGLGDITKTLINSFRIAGSTTSETTATIIQLSQAFASGTLRGQELRSVMLQNATLAELLRKKFGKNLAKDAEAGLIGTIDVLRILWKEQDRINKSAQTLSITFEQAVTKAMNTASFAIFNLNKQYDLSGKFAMAVDTTTDAMVKLFDIGMRIAHIMVPDFTAAMTYVGVALAVLIYTNPILAGMAAIAEGFILLIKWCGGFSQAMKDVAMIAIYADIQFQRLGLSIDKFIYRITGSKEILNKMGLELDSINTLTKSFEDYAVNSKFSLIDPHKTHMDELARKKERDATEKYYKDLAGGGKEQKIKEILGGINKEFLNGSISVGEYNKKLVNFELYKVTREFKEGKKDIFAYNLAMRDLKIQDLNRDLKEGSLTFIEYSDAVSKLKLDELKARFEGGRIGLLEYNEELAKTSRMFAPDSALIVGTKSYLDSIGTTTSNIADAIKSTFSSLEDSMIAFTKNGKFNFKEFTQAILDDLTRIVIRATIIRPLAEGLLGSSLFSSSGSVGSTPGVGPTAMPIESAKGNVFDNGLTRFATGGVVNSPTTFGYNGGRGLMGEAGPEAILPLKRGSGGNLGVSATVTPVTVNVINQTGNEVQQHETTGPNGEKTIDILITNKVRDGLMTGKFDKAFKQSYGLSRKGS